MMVIPLLAQPFDGNDEQPMCSILSTSTQKKILHECVNIATIESSKEVTHNTVCLCCYRGYQFVFLFLVYAQWFLLGFLKSR